jgi:cytochrome c peroxidase
MNRRTPIALCMVALTIIVALLISSQSVVISAQSQEPPFPVYNPYPPGILPTNLDSEIARVLREIDVIEGRAIQRWHSLPLPTPVDAPGPESAHP